MPEKSNSDKTLSDTASKSQSLKNHLVGPIPIVIFLLILVSGITLDLWTKHAVFNWLSDKQPPVYNVIDGFFRIVVAENIGAAFGIAAGKTGLLVAVSIIAMLCITAVFAFSGKQLNMTHIALGLFTAGLCGNLYDRIFNDGRVRDFIDIVYWPGKHWPAFNIADSMLCVGVALLIIHSLTTARSDQAHAQPQK